MSFTDWFTCTRLKEKKSKIAFNLKNKNVLYEKYPFFCFKLSVDTVHFAICSLFNHILKLILFSFLIFYIPLLFLYLQVIFLNAIFNGTFHLSVILTIFFRFLFCLLLQSMMEVGLILNSLHEFNYKFFPLCLLFCTSQLSAVKMLKFYIKICFLSICMHFSLLLL